MSSVKDDYNRVVLDLQPSTAGSDYVNASYVDVSNAIISLRCPTFFKIN